MKSRTTKKKSSLSRSATRRKGQNSTVGRKSNSGRSSPEINTASPVVQSSVNAGLDSTTATDPDDDNGPHSLTYLLESTQCLYPILTDDDVGITPFSLVRSGLVQTYLAIDLLAGLPVWISDVTLSQVLAEDVRPRHAVFLLSSEHIEEFVKIFSRFPFCAILDTRQEPLEINTNNPAWIYQNSSKLSVDAIIAHWKHNAISATQLIASHWSPSENATLSMIAKELAAAAPTATQALVPFPPQDCLRPNGILANLSLVGHQDAIFTASADPVDLEDINRVQQLQIELADRVRASHELEQIPAILIAPSPNPHLTRHLERRARGRPGLSSLMRSVLNERTYIFHTHGKELSEAKFADVRALLAVKTVERKWVDSVMLSAAAARGCVVFRTPQLPASLYQRLEHLAETTWSEGTKHRTMVKWERLCDELTEAVGPDLVAWLAAHSRRITAVSDLPLEWCKVNEIPLCFLRPVCRIPLALGECMSTYLRDIRPPSIWPGVEDLRILVLNGHKKTDGLRYYPELIARQSHGLGFRTQLCRTGDAQEVVEAINGFQPHLVILSAHGMVDTDDGAVIALADSSTPLRLEGLTWLPDAAIVSACRAEAVVRTFGSPASNLYGLGIRSVLGSYLNLTEPHATMMVSAILVNLRDALSGVQSKLTNWHDLVTMTLSMRRPVDILVAASRWHRRRGGKGTPMELFAAFTEWHNRRSNKDIVASWSETIEQLVSLAEGGPYHQSIVAMRQSRAFRPESMFYTQIGEPHRIVFGATRLKRTVGS